MLEIPEKLSREEWARNHAILQDAMHISIEYCRATDGQLPDYENLEALYINDYVDYSPEEILLATESEGIEDFQELIAPWCEDELREEQDRKEELLREIEARRAIGDLPDKLFNTVRVINQKGVIEDKDVPDDEKLTRFARWEVFQPFREDHLGNVLPSETLVNILLEISSNGRIRKGFQGKFLDVRKNVTLNQIEDRARFLGYLEYFYPEMREATSKEMKAASLLPIRLSFPQQPELYEKLLRLKNPEYYLDKLTGETFLGRVAVQAVLEVSSKNKNRHKPLYEVLTGEKMKYNFADQDHYKYRGLTTETCSAYGSWLLQVIRPVRISFDTEILKRAYRLNLGPGLRTIRRLQSGRMQEFYNNSENIPPGRPFSGMKFEDYVELVKKVASENEGKVTKTILRQRIADGHQEPHPLLYDEYGYTEILVTAGLDAYKEPVDPEYCLLAGCEYYDQAGKFPTSKVMKARLFPYSDYTIYKYFGSVPNFHEAISKRLALRDVK